MNWELFAALAGVTVGLAVAIISWMMWMFSKIDVDMKAMAQKLDTDIKAVSQDVKQFMLAQSERTDRLYTMFVDLLKERKGE